MNYNLEINDKVREYISEGLTMIDGWQQDHELTNRGMLYCIRCCINWLSVAAKLIEDNLSDN